MSITRLTGLSTGMDTDSIVKKLMDVERIPLNRLKQNQQKQMWLIDSYRQWNSDLFAFRNNNLFNMKLTSTFNTFAVDISQQNAVSATATSATIEGNYSIMVKQLASSATISSNKVKLDTSKSLGNIAQGSRQLTANTSISINVYNDPTNPSTFQTANIAVNTSDTISDVINRMNAATDANGKSLGLQALYDPNLQQFIIKTKATGETTKIDFSNSSASGQAFLSNTLGIGTNASVTGGTVNNLKIQSGENDSLTIELGGGVSSTIILSPGTYVDSKALVNEINQQIGKNSTLGTNVNASVDETGKIVLSSMATGSQSSITLTGNAVDALGYVNPATSSGEVGTLVATGQNADIIFNGQQIKTISANNVSLMGINLTLKGTTIDANGNLITSNVNITKNIDTAVKNIKDFVDKYNELLDKMNKATNEVIYRDYLPLTDEQREGMSEKQIEQWETRAKSGLLRGDSILTNVINKMRNEMTSVVNNGSSFNSLAAIGISSRSYQDRGKLYVDETKLKEALEKDPEAILKLFSQNGETSTGTNGLVNRVTDVMQLAVKNLTTKAGITGNSQYDQSVIGRLLSRMQTDITRQNDRLLKKEDQYYRQFAAMEAAVEKFNSQSSWLYQQSGGQY
jgi:flagellar hook-associated protein 2